MQIPSFGAIVLGVWLSCWVAAEDEFIDLEPGSLSGLRDRMDSAVPFIDPPREGQSTPGYLLESDFQQGKNCGPNSLYVLLLMLGVDCSYDDVLASVPVNERGSSMADIIDAASDFGVTLRPLQDVPPEKLGNLPMPLIARFNTPGKSAGSFDGLGHFVVVTGHDDEKRHFRQVDPSACSYLRASDAVVGRMFSGFCLVPDEVTPQAPSALRKLLWFAAFAIVLSWWLMFEIYFKRQDLSEIRSGKYT